MTRLGSLVLAVLFAAASAPAQWVQTSGPEGGSVPAIASDGTTIFAGTFGAGIFRSTDGGSTWEQKISGMGYQSVTAIAWSGSFLLATGTVGVYRSSDNGENWSLATGTPPGNGVSSLAVAGDTVFGGTMGKGVYRSTDNGATWSSSSTGLPNSFSQTQIGDIIIHGSVLLTSASDNSTVGIFRSTNMGDSWTISSTGITGFTNQSALLSDGATVYAGGPTVYKSTNDGSSWTPAAAGLPSDPAVDEFLLVGSALYASGSTACYRTTNGGANWEAVAGLPRESMAGLCDHNGTLLVGTGADGIYRSTDGGTSWVESNLGLLARDMTGFRVDGSTLYANGQGAFRTLDEGATWGPVAAALPDTLGPLATVYADGAALFVQDRTMGGKLYRSTDGGAAWEAASTGLPAFNPVTDIVSTGGTLVAAASNVFVSSDNGTTWSQSTTGMGTFPTITRLTFAGGALFASGNGVYRSTDGGAQWTAAQSGIPAFYSVDAFASVGSDLFAGSLYATALYRSTDNGDTWSPITSLPFSGSATSFMGAGSALFACSPNNGIFLSTNRGSNWSEISGNLPDHTYLYTLALLDGYLYAGSGGANSVWKRPLSDVTAVGDEPGGRPAAFALAQNYPNPFNPATTIAFTTPSAGPVRLVVVDILGREIATLVSGELSPGYHTAVWNAAGAPSGIYFCRLQAGAEFRTRSMLLAK